MLKITIPKRPEAFILGITGTEVSKEMVKLFLYTTSTARILYAQKFQLRPYLDRNSLTTVVLLQCIIYRAASEDGLETSASAEFSGQVVPQSKNV